MELWQALILGLVEGITEFLPVSSIGHLLVAQRMLKIPANEAANAYAVIIQAGAIAAVVGRYRQRIAKMARGLLRRERDGAYLAGAVFLAFLPAAMAGVAAESTIEQHLFGPWSIVAAWAAGGLLLLIVAPRIRMVQGKSIDEVSWRAAFIIGLAQCVALWPGVSRSLATILLADLRPACRLVQPSNSRSFLGSSRWELPRDTDQR